MDWPRPRWLAPLASMATLSVFEPTWHPRTLYAAAEAPGCRRCRLPSSARTPQGISDPNRTRLQSGDTAHRTASVSASASRWPLSSKMCGALCNVSTAGVTLRHPTQRRVRRGHLTRRAHSGSRGTLRSHVSVSIVALFPLRRRTLLRVSVRREKRAHAKGEAPRAQCQAQNLPMSQCARDLARAGNKDRRSCLRGIGVRGRRDASVRA